jgi:hypothetical protein
MFPCGFGIFPFDDNDMAKIGGALWLGVMPD